MDKLMIEQLEKNVGSKNDVEFHTWLEEELKEFTNILKDQKKLDKEIEAKERHVQTFKYIKGLLANFYGTGGSPADSKIIIDVQISRIKELIASMDEELQQIQEIVKHLYSTQKKIVRAHVDAIKNIDDAKCGLNLLFDRSLLLESDTANTAAKYEGLLLEHDYMGKELAECKQRLKKESRNLKELLLERKPLVEEESSKESSTESSDRP